ncbi:hypothetical protein Vadar_020010 [Vaccinium darrowii]|uniref:Uncharacterized protein n=1 Tax=Vaccinium darrowii TaxID=229202 RepID=A0ACB7YPE2_9ERIC|nr:hypothetical protein Vadar_020010 [Vaccinium darrowii]
MDDGIRASSVVDGGAYVPLPEEVIEVEAPYDDARLNQWSSKLNSSVYDFRCKFLRCVWDNAVTPLWTLVQSTKTDRERPENGKHKQSIGSSGDEGCGGHISHKGCGSCSSSYQNSLFPSPLVRSRRNPIHL